MPPTAPPAVFSTKRLILCSRENALRVASQICDRTRQACVIRTGHPLQPYRAAAIASQDEEIETIVCA